MKNIFRLSVMLLAATMAVGCSQNEEPEVAVPAQGDALTITVTANDFHSVEPASRAVENGYTTTFEAGKDQIGIYAISKTDGKVFIKNRPLKKGDDGNWTGDKIYYYKNTDYIAYFPYTEKLSAETITSEEDIVSYFNSKLVKEQGTKEAYYACDLMSARIEAANVVEDGELNFNFAHKLSMIEVKLPVRDYKTSEAADAYAYYVPVDLTLTVNGDNYTAYAIDKGVYRCIVAPTEEGAKLNVEGSFFDIDAPVTFSKNDITLAAGNYQKLNVNYAYDGYNPIRPLQVGDYYYADGNIYPGDLANPPASNCIGVIFATEGVNVTDGTNTWNHAYVFGLEAAGTVEWYPVTFTDTYLAYTSPNTEGCTAFFETLNGYELTHRNGTDNKNSTALKAALDFGKSEATLKYAVSETSTSGWFVPSPGELLLLVNNFYAGSDALPFPKTDEQYKTLFDAKTNQQQKKDAVDNLKKQLSNIGVTLEFSAAKSPTANFWYTSAEYSSSQVWAMEWKYQYANDSFEFSKDDQTLKFLARNKSIGATTQYITRPILAF